MPCSATGAYDRYCGTVKSDNSPCQHLVVNGNRYLVWPQLQYCCLCCTDAEGCGVVQPNWMVNVNATYIGLVNMRTSAYYGVANEWQADGLQPNFWYQTVSGAPVEFDQVPDDFQSFNPSTYSVGPQPDSLFTVPSYCQPSCPALSICSALKDGSKQHAGF